MKREERNRVTEAERGGERAGSGWTAGFLGSRNVRRESSIKEG
jgi:hypothetical protein